MLDRKLYRLAMHAIGLLIDQYSDAADAAAPDSPEEIHALYQCHMALLAREALTATRISNTNGMRVFSSSAHTYLGAADASLRRLQKED